MNIPVEGNHYCRSSQNRDKNQVSLKVNKENKPTKALLRVYLVISQFNGWGKGGGGGEDSIYVCCGAARIYQLTRF